MVMFNPRPVKDPRGVKHSKISFSLICSQTPVSVLLFPPSHSSLPPHPPTHPHWCREGWGQTGQHFWGGWQICFVASIIHHYRHFWGQFSCGVWKHKRREGLNCANGPTLHLLTNDCSQRCLKERGQAETERVACWETKFQTRQKGVCISFICL